MSTNIRIFVRSTEYSNTKSVFEYIFKKCQTIKNIKI